MTTATSRHRKEVFSGKYIDYDDPQPDQISLRDIAHGLAYTCRFGGHTRHFYSVAEHAILVSSLLLEQGASSGLALAGLHHDDHEAYLGDLPTPLKNALGDAYDDLRAKLDDAICAALGGFVRPFMFDTAAVHKADAVALRMEAHEYLPSRGNAPEWAPAWERFGLEQVPVEYLFAKGTRRWVPGLQPAAAERAWYDAHLALMGKLR